MSTVVNFISTTTILQQFSPSVTLLCFENTLKYYVIRKMSKDVLQLFTLINNHNLLLKMSWLQGNMYTLRNNIDQRVEVSELKLTSLCNS